MNNTKAEELKKSTSLLGKYSDEISTILLRVKDECKPQEVLILFYRLNMSEHPVKKEKYAIRHSYFAYFYTMLKELDLLKTDTINYVNLVKTSFKIKDEEANLTKEIEYNEFYNNNKFDYILYISSYRFNLLIEIMAAGIYCSHNLDNVVANIIKPLKVKSHELLHILKFLLHLLSTEKSIDEKKIYADFMLLEKYRFIDFYAKEFLKAYMLENSRKVNIAIFASMSAGKSTFINAILGKEILPESNQACTAMIVQICDNDTLDRFIGKINLGNKNVLEPDINKEHMKDLNDNRDVKYIMLEGNIAGLYCNNGRINLIDTPGANSARFKEHGELAREFIRDGDYHIIIYLIDSSSIASTDDQQFLTDIKSYVDDYKKEVRFVFVLNKIDKFDIESGENIDEIIVRIKEFLQNIGFTSPAVNPASSYAAKLFKKILVNDKLTRKESYEVLGYLNRFKQDQYNITNTYAKLYLSLNDEKLISYTSYKDKNMIINDQKIEVMDVIEALKNTGILHVESLINSFLGGETLCVS